MKKNLLIAGMLAITLTANADDGYVPEVWGNIINMTSWDAMGEYSKPFGVYSFPAKTDGFKFTQLSKKSTNFYATGNGIVTSDGIYHFTVYDFDDYSYSYYTQLYTYNTKTWELKSSPQEVSNSFRAFDLAQDPTDGTVYGFFMTDEGYKFGTVDYSTNKQNFITKSDTAFYGLACSNEGQLYAISEGGNLFKIAKDGHQTLVGSLGLREQGLTVQDRVQSATIDPRTDKMYWSAYLWNRKALEFKTGLYEIDMTTGKATLVVAFPELAQVVALYIPGPDAKDNAPAAATNVKALFSGPSLTGQVTFTAPAQTYAGKSLTGALTYSVTVDKDTLAKGSCNAGENVTASVTVAQGGKKEFTVRTANAAGESPKAETRTWVGYDQTSVPTHVTFSYDDAQAVVTWNTPDSTLHKGYMDAANMTYNIVRYPDSVVVGSASNSLTFREPLTSTTYKKYSYGVAAVNGGVSSETACSNEIAIGPAYDVPYMEDFKRPNAFDEYTAIDVNGDKKNKVLWGYLVENSGYWGTNSKGEPVYRSSDNKADDWLVTPGFNLKKDKYYKLSFNTYRGVKRYDEVMAVGIGDGMKVSAYKILVDSVRPEHKTPTPHSVIFTVNANGVYNIGFHAVSAKNQSSIFLNKIEVVETTADAIKTHHPARAQLHDVYTLSGVQVRRQVKSLDGLKKGVYIINGHKVVIK